MTDILCDVTVADGKYRYVQKSGEPTVVLRHGEPWRDVTGDGLICALAHEVQSLRDEIFEFRQAIDLLHDELRFGDDA